METNLFIPFASLSYQLTDSVSSQHLLNQPFGSPVFYFLFLFLESPYFLFPVIPVNLLQFKYR